MNSTLLRSTVALALAGALAAQIPNAGPYDCLTLHSAGNNGITFTSNFSPNTPLSLSPFTPADFAGACGGLPAIEVQPIGNWCASLNADPQARWISTTSARTPVSALYCQSFALPACGVQAASLRFSFCVDDQLGDPPAGANPIGVYLNGQPVAGFGGLAPSQTTWTSTAIAPLLVAGTNQLQVYVRDTGASIAGVMYSATICYVACRGDEVISLRSGNGSVGGPDGSIRMLVGAPFAPLPMTPANFAAAAGGPSAAIVSPSRLWCPVLSADSLARWIAIDQSRTASAALFSQPFTVTSCNVLSATLTFTCNVADFVGDPGGAPSVGVFVNQNPVPLSVVFGNAGMACDQVVTAAIPGSWLVGNGQNRLQVYMRDTGNAVSGVIWSATLRVRPCPPRTEVIALHSGNGTVGFPDAVIRCIDGPGGLPLSGPFTAVDFAAAAAGPAAHVVSNFAWAPSIAADPLAQWVSSTFTPFTGNPGAPRSALFAQPFTVATCAGDIKRASLVIRYHADDGLGDPVGGGPDPMGIYLNGQPVPGTQGDISTWPGTNLKTISVSNVAPFLVSGPNVLYVYVRDRLNAISGAMWSATISISPCDWHYFGEPCGVTVPNTFLSDVPTLGSTFEYRVRGDSLENPAFRPGFAVIGLSDQVGPGAAPLPMDLAVFGAPGCALQTSLDLTLFQILDGGGAASLSVTVPNLPGFAGVPLFFQTLMLDGVSNPLGLSATRGIAVDIRL